MWFGSVGKSCVINTYATLLYTNPLFIGFSCSQNVNKEIIQENIKSILHSGTSVLGCFYVNCDRINIILVDY